MYLFIWSQLHPDICGKCGHVDFIKLNEAYSILGRESTRQEYDLKLQNNRCNFSYTHTFYTQNK